MHFLINGEEWCCNKTPDRNQLQEGKAYLVHRVYGLSHMFCAYDSIAHGGRDVLQEVCPLTSGSNKGGEGARCQYALQKYAP